MNQLTPYGAVSRLLAMAPGLAPGNRCDRLNDERIGAEPGRTGEESEAGCVKAASEMRSYVEKMRFAWS